MTELFLMTIAISVMLFMLLKLYLQPFTGGLVWEHISTEKFQLVLVKLLMLGTEDTFRIVARL